MISIARHMDEYDIAEEVRLERKVHRGSFLLVEGITDIRRFGPFIDEKECSLVNCYGRRKAIEAIKILYDEGFPGALGAVDADFDRIDCELEVHEGLVYSESHDFDLDWAQPTVLGKYLNQVADSEKRKTYGSASEIFVKILQALKPVSVARLLNHRRRIGFRLSHIDVSACFVNFGVRLDAYVDLIFEGCVASEQRRIELQEQISRAKITIFINSRMGTIFIVLSVRALGASLLLAAHSKPGLARSNSICGLVSQMMNSGLQRFIGKFACGYETTLRTGYLVRDYCSWITMTAFLFPAGQEPSLAISIRTPRLHISTLES